MHKPKSIIAKQYFLFLYKKNPAERKNNAKGQSVILILSNIKTEFDKIKAINNLKFIEFLFSVLKE